MLRLLRSRPNPFTLAARVHKPAPQVFQVQRVKIRTRLFKPRNFLIAGCVYYVCYRFYEVSLVNTLYAWSDAHAKDMSTEERKELEKNSKREGDDSDEISITMRVPLPFTAKLVDSPPFKGTDPEWQAFVKISRSNETLSDIRNSLAELVCKTAKASNSLVRRCGSDMRLGRHWLDIQYPSRPPPNYVRWALAWADDGMYLVEESVDLVVAERAERALWPSTLTLSLWSFTGALLKQNAANFARLLGYEPNPTPKLPLQQAMEKFQQQIKKSAVKSDSKAPGSLPSAKTQAADGSSTVPASAVDKRSTDSSPPPGSTTASPNSGVSTPIPTIPNGGSENSKGVRSVYVVRQTREHISKPLQAFAKTFQQLWEPIIQMPPRGSIYITGLVEIVSSTARMTVDVAAFWDPKTESFDFDTAQFRLRTLTMRVQNPLR
ncbi:hypothetical protein GGR54DRAFT_102432 [Hypoxylon sp. NC1633]|nr:hypothetical protein GGR54DRAFT_102432 [Hypoxylon sp. NC1633]